jgi:hypothetical protein
MLNRLALCSLTRGLVLRTAQSAQLSARQLRPSNHVTEHPIVRPHHDPALSKTRRAERRADEKTLVKQALAGTDLREHLDEPAVLRLLNCTNSTHTYA